MSSSPPKRKMEGSPDSGLTSIGNYIFLKTLGEGNFAKVKLAEHKLTKQKVAIKMIDKRDMDETKLNKLYREVKIMKMLHHPNIVKLYEVLETRHTLFMIMEYVTGGELYDYLVVHGKMKEREACAKFRQLVSAVHYCHKKRVIHRDLKAENILLDKDFNIKIADFGFSNQYNPENNLDTFCGSPPYAAPELFQGQVYIGPEVDIWSCGVILYVMVTGNLPFEGETLGQIRQVVCAGRYRIPFYVSEQCEGLLKKMLVRNSQKRASLEIIKDDPWMNEGYDKHPFVVDSDEEVLNLEDHMILNAMEIKFGFDRNQVVKDLKANVYDERTAIYFLLHDEKKRVGDDAFSRSLDSISVRPGVRPMSHIQSVEPSIKVPIAAITEEDGGTSGTSTGDYRTANKSASRKTSNSASPNKRDSSGDENGNVSNNDVKHHKQSNPVSAVTRPISEYRRRSKTMSAGNAESNEPSAVTVKKEPADINNAIKNLQVQEVHQQNNITPVHRRAVSGPPTPTSPTALSNDAAEKALPSIPQEDGGEQKPVQRRRRTNTITDYIKRVSLGPSLGPSSMHNAGAANVPAPSSPTNSLGRPRSAVGSTSSAEDQQHSDNSQPRSLRFTFSSNTTSTKAPQEIMNEIQKSCTKNGFGFRLVSQFTYECSVSAKLLVPSAGDNEEIKFEVEVCKLPRLSNLHGLKFKRVSGVTSGYKVMCERLLLSMQL